MNTVRKAYVVHMYLIRNGYSDAANALWLMLALANVDCRDRQSITDWFNGIGSIDSFLNSILFLYQDERLIGIKTGFKTLPKLLAVLPKEIKDETQN